MNYHFSCSLVVAAMAASLATMASAIPLSIDTWHYGGPYVIPTPVMIDTIDVNRKGFDCVSILDSHLNLTPVFTATHSGENVPHAGSQTALHLLNRNFTNKAFAEVSVGVEGLDHYVAFIDGEKVSGKAKLRPGTHSLTIKYLTQAPVDDTLRVSLESSHNVALSLKPVGDHSRNITLRDILEGEHVRSSEVSPDGRFVITHYNTTRVGGKSTSTWRVSDINGNTITTSTTPIAWMPRTSRYYQTRQGVDGRRDIVATDPATGNEHVWAQSIPDGHFFISPAEDRLFYTIETPAPKEDSQIYQVTEPEDRQPYFRSRSYVASYDVNTGVLVPVTFGHARHNVADVSADGKKMLIMTSRSRLTKRPTTLFTLLMVDLDNMVTDTLIANDGFISSATFSPDAKKVLLKTGTEGLNRAVCTLPDDVIPSGAEYQLAMLDLASRNITPLTRDFDPSIRSVEWSNADRMIYFTADNRDYQSLYRLVPTTGKIEQIATPEEIVSGFSLSRNAQVATWWGESASSPDALYSLDTRRLTSSQLAAPSAQRLADVKLGECRSWNFQNSRGDSIYGRFYLPPDFDPSASYPMIVYYYGGCTPTPRYFTSRYPLHLYAAQGYVVYCVEPSGAIGFGQEFASRHVNTAGKGVAEDIIEGTQQFCKEHPFVDASRIGCIGASYGGFMTQYLQTVTDIFAAAVSHAGISHYTSYWGEGYWGYSYSELAMSDSYPWNRKDLYVDQSPLFNADKINTPLLFLHGDADVNVPVGESIQMFTALKLLGRETAFVAVSEQDHQIVDYEKRLKWQEAIFAWFGKYLQDQPQWWQSLYPEKAL